MLSGFEPWILKFDGENNPPPTTPHHPALRDKWPLGPMTDVAPPSKRGSPSLCTGPLLGGACRARSYVRTKAGDQRPGGFPVTLVLRT